METIAEKVRMSISDKETETIAEKALTGISFTLRRLEIIAQINDKLSYRINKYVRKQVITDSMNELSFRVKLLPKARCIVIGMFDRYRDTIILKNESDLKLLDTTFFKSELFPRASAIRKIQETDGDDSAESLEFEYLFSL